MNQMIKIFSFNCENFVIIFVLKQRKHANYDLILKFNKKNRQRKEFDFTYKFVAKFSSYSVIITD